MNRIEYSISTLAFNVFDATTMGEIRGGTKRQVGPFELMGVRVPFAVDVPQTTFPDDRPTAFPERAQTKEE